MSSLQFRTGCFTVLAMFAFAANSIWCRLALRDTTIDPVSFATIRLSAGAVMLWVIVVLRQSKATGRGSWFSGMALYAYAAAFSAAYTQLSAGTGALLLFGTVQATMISFTLIQGEKITPIQIVGYLLALIGLIYLVLPGVSAPPITSSLLMVIAGVAWAIYTLRGKQAGDPTLVTSQNFMYAAAIAIVVSAVCFKWINVPTQGILYALISGAITSGIGYAMWYAALPHLKGSTAATVQLSVPVLAAFVGIALMNELLSLRLIMATFAIISGISCVILQPFQNKKFD